MLGDRAVVVANDLDQERVLVWGVDGNRPLARFDALDDVVSDFAVAAVNGTARVVAAGERGILVGDPGTGTWEEPLTTHGEAISCLDVGVVNGHEVAVTGAEDGTVRIWDLAGRRLLSEPITGHRGEVFAVRVTDVDGRPVAISAGRDGVVRAWDTVFGSRP